MKLLENLHSWKQFGDFNGGGEFMYLFRSILYRLFHNTTIRNLSFSAPSKHIVWIVILWSLSIFISPNSHADWHLVDTLKGHTDAVNCIAFSPDGRLLASGSKDKTVIIWNALTGRREKTLTGHSGEIYSVAFSSDGQMLASASEDGNIILWNPETNEKLRIAHDGVHSITFSPDGQLLASGSWRGTIRLWNPKTGQQVQEVPVHRERVLSVVFSPDGTLLASSSWDGTIKLWNPATEKVVHEFVLPGGTYANFVTFNPDGRLLASGLQDGTIKLWDIETGELVRDLPVRGSAVISVVFISDSQFLISESQDYTIKIWNLKTQKDITTLKGHQENVNSVAFSSQNLLASASSDGTVKLWQNTDLSIITSDTVSVPPKIVITGSQIQRRSATFRFSVDPITVSDKLQYYWRFDKKQWTETRKTSVELHNLSDGFHLFEVKAVDMDGNESIAESSFYVEPTTTIVTRGAKLPETKITSKPESPVKNKEVTIRFEGEDEPQTPFENLRYKWCFDGGNWVETEERLVTLPNLSNGWRFFQVKSVGTDNVEDPTPAIASFEVAIEEQLPETEIVSAPEDTVKTSEVTIWFSGSDVQTPFENLCYKWRLDGGDWSETKETSVTLPNLSSEWHLFEVKTINANRYEDPTPAQRRFTVDHSEDLPDTEIDNAPTAPIKTAYYKFWFSGKDKQTPTERLRYSWRLDGDKSWSSPSVETSKEFTKLSNGQHLFEVKAMDTDGKEDVTPAKAAFTVEVRKEPLPPQVDEQQLPETQITYGPKGVVKAADVTFLFAGKIPKTPIKQLRYSWRLDDDTWSPLSSETIVHFDDLSNGKHLFQVKAVDADGKEDLTPAERWFTVEIDEKLRLPDTKFVEEIPRLLKANDVTINFKGIDSNEGLKYSWRLDGGKWSEPIWKDYVTLENLSDGWHKLEVKAILDDKEDPTPAVFIFQVDVDWELPKTEIRKAQESIVKTSDVTFQFTGEDLQIPPENLQYSWRMNEGPWIPSTEEEGHLSKEYGAQNAKWQLNPIAEEKGVFSLYLYDLKNGRHLFEVKAIDPDGNEDPTPAAKLFMVDVPPFYKSVLFISGVSSFLGAILVSFIIYWWFIRPWLIRRRKFNPYAIGEPIIGEEMFFGREKLLEKIIDSLNEQSVFIYGDRRIGKTTLLRQIEKKLEKPFLPIFVDLGNASEDEFFSYLMRTIIEGCEEYLNDLHVLRIQHNESEYQWHDFGIDLSKITKRLKSTYAEDTQLVLLLDEIDKVYEYKQDVLQYLRGIYMDFIGELKLVFAGNYISQKMSDIASPWQNFLEFIEIPPFTEADAIRLIRSPVNRIYSYSDEAIKYILEYSNLEPYYIQIFCKSAIERIAEENRKKVTLDDVEYVLSNVILKNYSQTFQHRWDAFDDDTRKAILVAIESENASNGSKDEEGQSNLLLSLNIANPFKEWIKRSYL